MEFEWDDAKAALNLQRHGVDFLDAIEVFQDAFRIDEEDARYDYGERRWKVTGFVDDLLLVVVFTEREERTRLISARLAEPYEKRAYYEGQVEGRGERTH